MELATRLDRSRFDPIVYSLGPPPPENKQRLVQRLAAASIPTHFLGLTSSLHYFAAVRQLAQLLRQQQAEIVQTFLFHANVVGTQAARIAGVPHVLAGIRVADPRRWRTAVEPMTLRVERFVCVSQSVAEFYRRRGFCLGETAGDSQWRRSGEVETPVPSICKAGRPTRAASAAVCWTSRQTERARSFLPRAARRFSGPA